MPVFVEYQIFNWMVILVKIRSNEIHRRVPLNSRKQCYTRIFNIICIMRHMNAQKIRVSTAWSTIGTFIYTVCSRYSYLHCLQQVQLSTLSAAGTTIYTVYNRYNYLRCQQQVQLSTLSIVGTSIYTVHSRYSSLHCVQQVQLSTLSTVDAAVYSGCSCLHCQQQVQLSTLSTIGKTIYTQSTIVKTIYTVYNRYSYLHRLQHVSQLYLLQKVLLKFAEKVHLAKF